MLSFGWPEMLIVAAAALIIVGPKDLPLLLRNIGRVIGKVRRMGNDFKSELNKVAALDDIKDIKKSITQPIASTQADIEKEFNKIKLDGSVEPSGKLTSKNSNSDSVYDEIKQASAKVKPVKSKPAKNKPDSASVAKAAKQEEDVDEGQVASVQPIQGKKPDVKKPVKSKPALVIKKAVTKKKAAVKKPISKKKTLAKTTKTTKSRKKLQQKSQNSK